MKPVLGKLIHEGKDHKGLFFFALFCMFFSGLSNVLPSWLVKISIDGLAALEEGKASFEIFPKQLKNISFIPGDFALDPSKLHLTLPVMIIAVFIIDAFFKFLYQYNVRKVGLNVVRSLREKFHYHLNRLSLATQGKYDSGSLVSVVTSDLHNLQSWVAESLTNLFNDGFKAVFLVAWLLILDWKLTVLTMLVIPAFAVPVAYLGKRIRSASKSGQDYIGTLTTFVAESLYNQKILKAFNLENWRQKNFIKESDILYSFHKKWVLFMALVSPLTNIIGALGIASILYFGLSSVTQGRISVGEFSSFFVTTILLYDPVKRIGRVSTIIQSALGVADRVFGILDEPTQQHQAGLGQTESALLNGQGDIKFNNVSYSYDDKSELLFENLNLDIKAKSCVALVGPSGGGKTTLVSLLPRFYELNSGLITIDGTDIKELSLEELRGQIALVTQEPLLFTGTIRDNILIGDVDASEVQIQEAARKAHVLEFADELAEGLDTDIGERGQGLSVGQRQRVALARAFLSDAPIMILDEPTSALDNESQAYVQDAIEQLMQERTMLIIAHRLSTVEKCDQIVFIEDGQIRESGSHKELALAGDSAYSKLLK